jgi:internalin A
LPNLTQMDNFSVDGNPIDPRFCLFNWQICRPF